MSQKPHLSPLDRADLAASCPSGPVPVEVFDSWLEIKWVLMGTYARGRQITLRRIASWWSRVQPSELESARERLESIASEEEAARLNALAETYRSTPGPPRKGGPLRLVQSAGGRRP